MIKTDNYKKHTTTNPIQRILINNFYRTLLKEIGKYNPQTILDVGCGEGFTLEKIRENNIGHDLTGLDFSESAITLGRRDHPELKLQHGSIYQIPFKENSFDLVICTEVLEHLESPEKALKELERVTKKFCIISVPHEPWFMAANFLRGKNLARWGNDIEHIQHWSRRGISSLVNKYLSVIEIKQPFPWTLLVAEKK